MGELIEDAARQRVGIERRAQPGLDDGELVAAEAGERVGPAKQLLEPARHELDQLVAGLVAIGVVDVLEAVEVEEHHREPAAGALDAGKLLVEPFPEQEAVRQPRQRVAAEKVLRMLLARGEVARNPADVADDEEEKRDRDERAEQGQRHEPLAHEVARPLGRPGEVGRRVAGAVEDRKTDRAVARLLGCDAQAVDGVEIGEATQLRAFEPLVAGDDERLPAGAPRHRHRDGGEHGGAVEDEARDRKVARHGAVARSLAGTAGGVGARRLDEVGEECRPGAGVARRLPAQGGERTRALARSEHAGEVEGVGRRRRQGFAVGGGGA